MNKELTIDDIVVIICRYFNITAQSLFKKSRKREIITARMGFYYLAKNNTKLSLAAIGSVALDYGREKKIDHATVLHGLNELSDLISVEKNLEDMIDELNELIPCTHSIVISKVDLVGECENNLKKAS